MSLKLIESAIEKIAYDEDDGLTAYYYRNADDDKRKYLNAKKLEHLPKESVGAGAAAGGIVGGLVGGLASHAARKNIPLGLAFGGALGAGLGALAVNSKNKFINEVREYIKSKESKEKLSQ